MHCLDSVSTCMYMYQWNKYMLSLSLRCFSPSINLPMSFHFRKCFAAPYLSIPYHNLPYFTIIYHAWHAPQNKISQPPAWRRIINVVSLALSSEWSLSVRWADVEQVTVGKPVSVNQVIIYDSLRFSVIVPWVRLRAEWIGSRWNEMDRRKLSDFRILAEHIGSPQTAYLSDDLGFKSSTLICGVDEAVVYCKMFPPIAHLCI